MHAALTIAQSVLIDLAVCISYMQARFHNLGGICLGSLVFIYLSLVSAKPLYFYMYVIYFYITNEYDKSLYDCKNSEDFVYT